MHREVAEEIVDRILLNLADRVVLGDDWVLVDQIVQEEIRDTWIGIVMNVANGEAW